MRVQAIGDLEDLLSFVSFEERRGPNRDVLSRTWREDRSRDEGNGETWVGLLRGRGGIGIRASLRGWCQQWLKGSSPFVRTKNSPA